MEFKPGRPRSTGEEQSQAHHTCHFKPTYNSWLNQVKRWFALITNQAIFAARFREGRYSDSAWRPGLLPGGVRKKWCAPAIRTSDGTCVDPNSPDAFGEGKALRSSKRHDSPRPLPVARSPQLSSTLAAMRVTILGTRGNVRASAPRHAKHSGILVDSKLLLDLGEASYLDYQSRHIFITHLHPDHAVFTSAPDMRQGVKIYVPEPTKKAPNAHVIASTVRIDSYRVIPVPTIHSHRARSVGYVVENKGRSFFYSSDMVLIEPQYHKRLRGVEMVITEGSYIRRGGLVRIDRDTGEPYGHTGIPNLIEFFRPFARCIVITHFGSWFYKDIDASIRKVESLGDGVRVVAAYDGLTLEI